MRRKLGKAVMAVALIGLVIPVVGCDLRRGGDNGYSDSGFDFGFDFGGLGDFFFDDEVYYEDEYYEDDYYEEYDQYGFSDDYGYDDYGYYDPWGKKKTPDKKR